MTHITDKTDTITVFCLNLRFGLADDGPHSWKYRKHAYPDLLESHAADFYGFQEANDFQATFLSDILADYKMIGQRLPAPDNWQNNIIFYHNTWKCLNSAHFYLSSTPDTPSKFQDSQWPRQCTMGSFQKGGFRITVVNTHFDFKPEVQRKSASLILERLNQIKAWQPVVLMGDLNAGPHSSCIEEFKGSSGGFKSAHPSENNGTHHDFSGVAQEPPIDWILYRGGLERVDSAIIKKKWKGHFPSDHFPITATFTKTGRCIQPQ